MTMFAWPFGTEPGVSLRTPDIQERGPLKVMQNFKSIEVLGRAPHFQKNPSGFHIDSELRDLFEDVYTHKYTTPSFTSHDHWKAISRYEQYAVLPDKHTLERAKNWVITILRPHIWGYRVASHEEVLANWDMSTSTGYPYSEVYPTKGGLRDAIGLDWLRASWAEWCSQPYKGMWKQFLKEELRKENKDTRGVVCAPLDTNYNSSRLFLNFNKLFYEAYLKIPSAVGISRDGLDWNRLYRLLAQHEKGFSIDFKQFDSKMTADLLRAIRDVRKTLLHPLDKDSLPLFDAIYEELENTYILVDGYVVKKCGGNPTGSSGTTPDNCIADMIQMIYAFMVLNPKSSLADFKKSVKFVVYGDDNTTSADFANVVFTPDDIAPVLWQAFGSTIVHDGIKNVEELSFLSAGFLMRFAGGTKVAVPLMDQEKMICHIVEGAGESNYLKFQRIVSLRDICIWDDLIVERLTSWLIKHKHYVTIEDFSSWVLPVETIRARYVFPKKKLEPFRAQGFNNLVLKPNRGQFKGDPMSTDGAWNRKIEALLDQASITERGRTYLQNATNPFPDYAMQVTPSVDAGVGSVLPLCISLEQNIGMPQSLIDSGVQTWDLLVWHSGSLVPNKFTGNANETYLPLVEDIEFAAETTIYRYPEGAGHNFYPIEPVSWIAVPTGRDVFPQNPSWIAPAADCFGGLNFNPYLDNGVARLISLGFETRNNTAELYKGGSVMVGMVPQAPENIEQQVRHYGLPGASSYVEQRAHSILYNAPPSNAAMAKAMEGTVQYEAKEGSYCVMRPTKEFNDLKPAQNGNAIWAQHWPNPQGGDYPASDEVCVHTGSLLFPRSVTISGVVYNHFTWCNPPIRPSGYHSGFTYYTGLPKETKINLQVRGILEKIPDFGSRTEQALAQRANNYDPAALELLTKVFNDLPYGVPVRENDMGTWFRKVAAAVSKYAPTVGTGLGSLGVPGAGLIGQALAKGASAYLEHAPPEKAKPKKKAQAQKAVTPMPPKEPQAPDRSRSRSRGPQFRPKRSVSRKRD